MKSRGQSLLTVAVALVCFLLVQHIAIAVMTSAYRLYIIAEIDHPDIFQLYYNNSKKQGDFKEKDSERSQFVNAGEKTKVKIRLADSSVLSVRLDTGNEPGIVKIYRMEVHSHFVKPRVLLPSDIDTMFKSGKDDVMVNLEKDHVSIISQNEDPYIIGTEPLVKINAVLPNAIAFLFSCVVSILFYRFDFATFPPFYDILRKKPTTGINIDALDGLRGLAAVIIVADHTYGFIMGIGAIGVWLFMTLSGFLLARPFIQQPERCLSLAFWEKFFIRRIKRIIPLYYAYLTVVYVVPGRFDEAFRHFFFLQGDGVLWVINQEIVFYLMVPFIMMANYFLFRGKVWPIVLNLVILMFLSYYMVGPSVFSMYGMNHQPLRLYVGIFLAGIIFSYLYYGVYEPAEWSIKKSNTINTYFSMLGIAILIGFMLFTTGRVWGKTMVWGIAYDQWFGIASGMFIFCIVASRNTTLERILAFLPLRAIGLVSFSMYILHPMVVILIRQGSSYYFGISLVDLPLFFCTVASTYLVSCVTYAYIERPFTRPPVLR